MKDLRNKITDILNEVAHLQDSNQWRSDLIDELNVKVKILREENERLKKEIKKLKRRGCNR